MGGEHEHHLLSLRRARGHAHKLLPRETGTREAKHEESLEIQIPSVVEYRKTETQLNQSLTNKYIEPR